MSRSAFAARFTEVVGEPAGSYCCEAAFARAFKRIVGSPLGATRRAGTVETIGG